MIKLRRAGPRPGLLSALLVFLILLAPSVHAGQQEAATPPATPAPAGPEIVLQPADGVDGDYFTIEAEPGSSHDLTVVLGNAGDEPLALRTFVNDAIPVTNGGFALADAPVPPTGPATWIGYPTEEFDFGPGEGVERTFTVTVPDGTEPGQYIAGLALETAEPLAVEGSTLFNQVIRKAVAVFIIVPGPVQPEFALGQPSVTSGATARRVDIPVTNDGNVLVKPQGELSLHNEAGESVVTVPITMGSVYAGTTVPLSVTLPSNVPDGDYTVQLSLSDAATGATAELEPTTLSLGPATGTAASIEITGEVSLQPDAADPAFAGVALTIANAGEPVMNAEVVLEVTKDGEPVEQFPLATSQALPAGETTLEERYIPPDGFEPGVWAFVVHLNVIDPATGAATEVATLTTIPPVEVG